MKKLIPLAMFAAAFSASVFAQEADTTTEETTPVREETRRSDDS